VVSITSRQVVESRRGPFFNDPFFRHFFRDFGPSRPERRDRTSLGSGVIVGGDGLIVTNQHVVADADEITVVLHDRREFEAELIADDELSDLAFLRIDPGGQPLPALSLGDSDLIEVGDLVLAIGNPFGIGQTVTSGIISAKARTPPGGRSEVSFIQTDAAINPGNSGGALVSLDGELVGINTAIFTRGSGGSIGIGFAIPANLVKARLQGIEAEGEVVRPWLGAAYQPVDAGIAAALELDRPAGLLVNRLHSRSPAARAGLKEGDVILAVDGVEVNDAPSLNLRLSLKPLGETVEITVFRRGERLTLEVPLEEAPREPSPNLTRLEGPHPLDGVTVANMSPAFNEEIGVDMFEEGVVILEIRRGAFAQRLRLRPGDVVASVNGRRVETVAELRDRLRQRTSVWQLGIRRDGRTFTLEIS